MYKVIHLKEGYSMRQIAAKVPCGLSTVVRTLKRFSETNFIVDRGKLNSSQILKQWTLTSNASVCPRTVRGRLLEIRLRGCKARPKPLRTEFQRKRRLTWAREHSLWTIKDWEKVIFRDESQFCISGNQSSAYVRRHTQEEFSPQCLKPTVKYPTKVMVWGCMSSHGVGRLHIVSRTVKAMDYIEILQNKLLPTVNDLLGNHSSIFQDDNAPCHRVKVVQKWLKDHTVNRMNCPGQSPDLNPLENLWFKIGRIIGKLEKGRSVTSVAAEFRIAHSIVSRIWRQFQTTGTAIQGFSSGRPRGITPADDRYIVLQARRNRRQTAGEIARHTTQATGRPISCFTVARKLHGGGLFARRPVRCVPLTPAHRRRRSLWCREHRNRRDNEWGRVLFTDEQIQFE
ncbi:transposable element Tcb1 transposase [Trichonephila clavipes]|nr:transposable element Tcb1 transposase [Trichonephila clavipes]